MSEPSEKADLPLDVREAQERLAAEFPPETSDSEPEETEPQEGQVVTLNGDEPEEHENPFAKEAADAEALRRLVMTSSPLLAHLAQWIETHLPRLLAARPEVAMKAMILLNMTGGEGACNCSQTE